ncbi:hypothetical protein ACFSO7_01320 [Bacillus sp. CGMCC 1.16607]|uniref:hypothetical protein n=1 Tax=Bacillus sp. CGMCC 1.16607 TaxID=3351842 RepID=UPI00364123D4
MNLWRTLLDEIISKREFIYQALEPLKIRWIRLYGSVLARKETCISDVDLYIAFDEHENGTDCWDRRSKVEDALHAILNRRIGVQCEAHIYEKFRETTERDSIDLRDLLQSKHYQITPKSSALYYEMLRFEIEKWNEFYIAFSSQEPIREWFCDPAINEFDKQMLIQSYCQYHIVTFIRRSTWWFSRLMHLEDNDIFEQSDFDLFGLIRLGFEEENTLTWVIRFDNDTYINDIEYINICVHGLSKWIKKKGY